LLEKNFSITTSYEYIFANGKFNSAIYHYDQFILIIVNCFIYTFR